MYETSSQVSYKLMDKNPMGKNRVPTDTACLYIFGLGLVAWFIMNCFYLVKGNTVGALMKDENLTVLTLFPEPSISTVPIIFDLCGAGLIVWITLIGTSIFLVLLKTLHSLPPKFGTVVGLISLILTVALVICQIVWVVYSIYKHSDPRSQKDDDIKYFRIILMPITIFLITGISAVHTVKIAGLVDIVKKASDAIFFFPTLFLLSAAITFLNLLVIVFTGAVLYNTDIGLIGLLSMFGASFLTSVFYNFGEVVIGQCVSTWYWSENREELSGALIFKSMGLIVRNHMGTIALGSTYIVPVFLSLFVLRDERKKFQVPPRLSFTAVVVKFSLISRISHYALMVTASHGLSFQNATIKIFRLFTRSCFIVMAFSCVFEAILRFFLVISMFITMVVARAIFQETLLNSDPSKYETTVVLYYFLGFFVFTTTYLTAISAANMVLVNTTEEIEENEEQEINQIQSITSE